MTDLNTALIAFVGVLAGGYFNNFIGEDYRRFRDSQALAGALAGELDSHSKGMELLSPILVNIQGAVTKDIALALPEFPPPPSPVFEALVDKIGSLGPDLARDVAFVYEQITAFRTSFHMLSKHHQQMPQAWREGLVRSARDRLDSAAEKGPKLLNDLTAHAKQSYWRHSAIPKWAATLAAVVIIGFGTWAVIHTHEPNHVQQCTTTLDPGALHTVCK